MKAARPRAPGRCSLGDLTETNFTKEMMNWSFFCTGKTRTWITDPAKKGRVWRVPRPQQLW